jgi:hypothetical protein
LVSPLTSCASERPRRAGSCPLEPPARYGVQRPIRRFHDSITSSYVGPRELVIARVKRGYRMTDEEADADKPHALALAVRVAKKKAGKRKRAAAKKKAAPKKKMAAVKRKAAQKKKAAGKKKGVGKKKAAAKKRAVGGGSRRWP